MTVKSLSHKYVMGLSIAFQQIPCSYVPWKQQGAESKRLLRPALQIFVDQTAVTMLAIDPPGT